MSGPRKDGMLINRQEGAGHILFTVQVLLHHLDLVKYRLLLSNLECWVKAGAQAGRKFLSEASHLHPFSANPGLVGSEGPCEANVFGVVCSLQLIGNLLGQT